MQETSTTPLLLVAPAPRQAELALLLRAGGGAWSGASPVLLDTPEAALREARGHPPHTPLPLVWQPDPQADLPETAFQQILAELNSLPHIAPVLLTDRRPLILLAQAGGHPVARKTADFSATILADMLCISHTMAELRLSTRHAHAQWELSDHRFRDMADQFADWLWEIDTSLRIVFSSSRKRPAQGATRGSAFVASFLPEERLRIEDDFAELIRAPRGFHDRDYWAADPYGTRVCWSVSGTPVFGSAGQLTGFRGLARDVSPMKIATDQLYYLTNHDPLTGLANRHRFADELARTLRLAARENRSGALVLLDLDHFALINHTHGHAVGDKALVHFAQILKDHIRTNDLVARLDGDQFGLILRDVRPADLPARLTHLQSTLAARTLPLANGIVTLNASGGVAFYPEHAVGEGGLLAAEDLHANALDALIMAKQRGPGRLETYNPIAPSQAGAGQRLQWIEFLAACLAAPEERLLLHFQPIMPLARPEDTEFYEVLVRLRDENGQAIPAQQYITIAEEAGFAPRLDRLVFQRALGLLRGWLAGGRRVRLSVNVSARTMDDPTFLPEVLAQLQAEKLPHGALVMELTETALLRDLPAAKAFISQVRRTGAAFALDDCGIGYSSLNYLKELELDYLKIDGTFIRNLHTSPDDQAVVRALISIARQRGIATIAEMVEHAGALEMAKTLEIDFGQGFYFAPPGAELQTPTAIPASPPTRW